MSNNAMAGPPVSLYQAEAVADRYSSNQDSGLCGPRGGDQSLASLRFMGGGSTARGEVSLLDTVRLANCMRREGATSIYDPSPYREQNLTDRRYESSVFKDDDNFPPQWDESGDQGWAVKSYRKNAGDTRAGAQYVNIWQWTDVYSTGKSKLYEAFVKSRQTARNAANHDKTFSLISFSNAPYNGLVSSTSNNIGYGDADNVRVSLSANYPAKVILASFEAVELFVNQTTPDKVVISRVERIDLKRTP